MQKYVFHKYVTKYKKYFDDEYSRLSYMGGDQIRIEHVGSTSVPGLGGKGIIDIVIGVGFEEMVYYKQQLEKGGYEFRENASFPERLFFRKDYFDDTMRRVHIHLVTFNGKDWQQMIRFRDNLRENKKLILEYEQLKKNAMRLAKGDGEKYRKYKEKFIQEHSK